jgi:ketosteroid isomerase-like protein
MKYTPAIAQIFIAALLAVAGCNHAPKSENESKTVQAEILALENQWASAIERQDAATCNRLATEDYRFIDENGSVLNRAQYIYDRSHNKDKVESAVQDEIEVRQHGDAAITTGRSILHGSRDGVPFVYRFRWTGVYVRRSGRWQAASGQLTTLPAVAVAGRANKRSSEHLAAATASIKMKDKVRASDDLACIL